MRSETNTLIEQQFLMVFGRLGKELIQDLDDKIIERLRGGDRIIPEIRECVERYNDRERSGETAIFTLYAYADISLGRRYETLWLRHNPSELLAADCVIEHILFEGWFPAPMIEHGHKHILFVRMAENVAGRLPVFNKWDQIGNAVWMFGISDRIVAQIRQGDKIR